MRGVHELLVLTAPARFPHGLPKFTTDLDVEFVPGIPPPSPPTPLIYGPAYTKVNSYGPVRSLIDCGKLN